MAEITRVPIQPVAQGSLTKLWLGVVLAIALGGGLAWAAVPKGYSVDIIVAGDGETIQDGQVAFVKYKGKLAATGEQFDESRELPPEIRARLGELFPEGQMWPIEEGTMIDGFYNGLKRMKKGGQYEIYIPADLAYGAAPPPGSPIPPDADLIFEVEIIDVMEQATFERNMMIAQQIMQQSAPGGPMGAGPVGPPSGAPAP